MATPDLGTASAGRAAAADNAATAFGNPAGMTRLDQSQMLVGIQPGYGITHFDKDNETTVSGGNGGNALGFHSRARRLLRLQRHARSQVRPLAGLRLRPLRPLPEQLVRPLLRPAGGDHHPRRLSGGGLSDQPVAVDRRRRADHLRQAELEDRDQRRIRRRRRQHRRLAATTSATAASPAFSSSRSRARASASPTPPRSSSTSRKSRRPTTSGRC